MLVTLGESPLCWFHTSTNFRKYNLIVYQKKGKNGNILRTSMMTIIRSDLGIGDILARVIREVSEKAIFEMRPR